MVIQSSVATRCDSWINGKWYRGRFGGGILASEDDYQEVLKNHEKYPYEDRVIELPKDYEWLLMGEIQSYWEIVETQ
jgi:hypothetical protein